MKTASIRDRHLLWAEGKPYPMPQGFFCSATRSELNEPDLIPCFLKDSTWSRRFDPTGRANPATQVRKLPAWRVISLLPRLQRRLRSLPTGRLLQPGSPDLLHGLRALLAATTIESA